MKKIVTLFACFMFVLGCARVRVEAPKEPIKVDISMRLDIYQHVTKDIDDIESIVSGASVKDKQSLLDQFVSVAYAADGLSTDIEAAALRRRDRNPELMRLEKNGSIGESKDGFVVERGTLDTESKKLLEAENADRLIIYKGIAQKNGTNVSDVQGLYAKKLQENAPSGTPVEVLDASSGAYVWETK